MPRTWLYIIAVSVLVLNPSSSFAQTWCPVMRVSPFVTDHYVIFGQGLTADNYGRPWCGWCGETFNPHAWNLYVSHYSDTAWCHPDTIFPLLGFENCDLTTDASGNIWVVAEEEYVSACFYDGSSWSDLMAVPTQGTCCHFPIATGDSIGSLWVCWAGGGPGDGHHIWGNTYISGSWRSPVLVSYPYTAIDEYTYSMTADTEGRVWVGWYGFSGFDEWIYASFNDGNGWSDTMMIAEHTNYTRGPALTSDTSGNVWAGWINRSTNGRNIYASYYDGSVWSEPMLVSSEPPPPFPIPGDWPIAMVGDDAGMVWLTWVNADTNIYYSFWDGNNWSNPAPVDTHPAKEYNLKMTYDGERVWVSWIRRVGLEDTLTVYASYTYGLGVEEAAFHYLPSTQASIQNYPNPFSTNTVISCHIPAECHISLKIYDVYGNVVKTFINRGKQAGRYIASWGGQDEYGKDCPSGVYFVRLEASNYGETRKITKLK